MIPVRLQLSRRKGFDLQATSQALNGLEAVVVARPGQWGNPFIVNPNMKPGRRQGPGWYFMPTAEDAVACFVEMLSLPGETADHFRRDAPKLAGKNLACWCKPGAACHADVLLALANGEAE